MLPVDQLGMGLYCTALPVFAGLTRGTSHRPPPNGLVNDRLAYSQAYRNVPAQTKVDTEAPPTPLRESGCSVAVLSSARQISHVPLPRWSAPATTESW